MTTISPDAAAPARRRLFIVDDDKLFLEVFAANLRTGGYVPVCYGNPEAALAALTRGTEACACVLDLDMPELDGLGFLRALNRHGIGVPVIFVTNRGNPIFEEQALRDGAVDFIDKSRGPAIILRRIELATRPRQAAPWSADGAAPDLRRGRLRLHRQARRALWNDREVSLSRAEYDVVLCLAAAPGTDVAYRDIYNVIKGEGFLAGPGEEGYRANVRAMVKRIRRKFEDIDPGFACLETYPGFGYRWRDDG